MKAVSTMRMADDAEVSRSGLAPRTSWASLLSQSASDLHLVVSLDGTIIGAGPSVYRHLVCVCVCVWQH